MYGLSLPKIPYADFPDTFIYVHSLIENLIFEVIILIDVCHFDQAVAHRCFVRTILQVSLSLCLSLLTFSTAEKKKKKRKPQWSFRKRRCLASLRNFIVALLLKPILFQTSSMVMEEKPASQTQCRRRKTSRKKCDLSPPTGTTSLSPS